tara:strand:- start:50 stop:202 length:153 start_codon:yes stop_codon:yes gene_type:complete
MADEIKPFETDEPHLKGIYNVVNAMVTSQKILVELLEAETNVRADVDDQT